jgi:hypothetical protein
MPDPIGYFTNHTPGDGTLFDELEQNYGSSFEKLTRRQKLYLIMAISADLVCQCPETDPPISSVSHIPHQVHKLEKHDAEGFLDFLIAAVRFGIHAQPRS